MPIINYRLWEQILTAAERSGIPSSKKRGIVRECLQAQILYHFYNIKDSRYLIFCGGTSLRFLYDNQRLSEDLDFDMVKKGVPLKEILQKIIHKQAGSSQNDIEFKLKEKTDGATAYFKYRTLLPYLKISQHKDEKLMIKFDFSYPEDKIKPVDKSFSKFGYLQNVLTYDQSSLLSFKTRALFRRKTERGRDLYDIAKLRSFNVRPNLGVKFLKQKSIKTDADYVSLLNKWYSNNQALLPKLKKQLLPFLINEEEIKYLDFVFDK